MNAKTMCRVGLVGLVSGVLNTSVFAADIPLTAAGGKKQGSSATPPDLTQRTDNSDIKSGIRLGPTGARGWIWADGDTTRGAKQIYIYSVAKDSPSDRVLQKGDVILGVVAPDIGSGLFKVDARREFGTALTAAEREENKGMLKLKIWRAGKTMEASLQLKVMGTYSATAPRDCKKTLNLVDQMCKSIEKQGFTKIERESLIIEKMGPILKCLGLLSTGRAEYIPMVEKVAHDIGFPDVKLDIETHVAQASWNWGYSLLFLTEYYLITEDKYVLPAITEYATKLAMGQTSMGTWGHMMANKDANDGKLHGTNIGYGSMNQPSLVCAMALVLAQKCGVNNDEIEQAIKRSTAFYRYFVDRGGIPYGDHGAAADANTTNGKTALAALFFNVLGDKEAATFFSRLAVAGFNEREGGHTGPYFNQAWGALAAACAGDDAYTAYMRERQWFMDLERDGEGVYHYQDSPTRHGQPEQASYDQWTMTGFRLMQYCAPLRKLYITGKGGQVAHKLAGSELDDTIRMGQSDSVFTEATEPQLLQWLGSRSPRIRIKAANELGERNVDCSTKLLALLEGPDRFARYGACLALGQVGEGSPEKIKTLSKAAGQKEDQMLAENALAALSSDMFTEHKADVLPVLLKMAATSYPGDPRGHMQVKLCTILFGSMFRPPEHILLGVDPGSVDRSSLLPALKGILKIRNGTILGALIPVVEKLTDEDLKFLLKDGTRDIYEIAAGKGVYGMDGGDIQRALYLILLRHHDAEALDDQFLKERVGPRWDNFRYYGRRLVYLRRLLRFMGDYCDAVATEPAKPLTKAITLKATDPDGDDLKYTIVTPPAHGTLSGTAPNVIYTSGPDFKGTDSFTFKASDGQGDSPVATVNLTVDLVPPAGPPGYTYVSEVYFRHSSVSFNKTVNVACGVNGSYTYKNDVKGEVDFYTDVTWRIPADDWGWQKSVYTYTVTQSPTNRAPIVDTMNISFLGLKAMLQGMACKYGPAGAGGERSIVRKDPGELRGWCTDPKNDIEGLVADVLKKVSSAREYRRTSDGTP